MGDSHYPGMVGRGTQIRYEVEIIKSDPLGRSYEFEIIKSDPLGRSYEVEINQSDPLGRSYGFFG